MISLYIAIALIGILSAVVSGNNISAAVGTIVGSRIVSRHFGLTLGATGFSLGLIIEGRFLSNEGNADKTIFDHCNHVGRITTSWHGSGISDCIVNPINLWSKNHRVLSY